MNKKKKGLKELIGDYYNISMMFVGISIGFFLNVAATIFYDLVEILWIKNGSSENTIIIFKIVLLLIMIGGTVFIFKKVDSYFKKRIKEYKKGSRLG